MVQQYLEDLYTAGDAKQATAVLRNILDTISKDTGASKATVDWVMGMYRHLIRMDLDNAA